MKPTIRCIGLITLGRGFFLGMIAVALSLYFAHPAMAEEVVQIDVKSILTTRSVTTLTDGKIVPWITGIDGGGTFGGYMTMAAALFIHDTDPLALPDSGIFPATSRLPRVVLNYSNYADSKSNQTYFVKGLGQFSFDVPNNKYSKMFIFLTLGEGAYNLEKGTLNLRVSLTYTDGTVSSDYLLFDYATNYPDNDTNFCNLISDRTKWNQNNKWLEIGRHNIHALNVHTDVNRVLTSIKVEKTKIETQYAPQVGILVFWGATGIASNISSVKDQSVEANNGFVQLERASVFPSRQGFLFINLPNNTEIGIYSVTGRLVAHLAVIDASTINWNPISKIAVGTYICALQSSTASKSIEVLVGQ
jgi:hypothetical protein